MVHWFLTALYFISVDHILAWCCACDGEQLIDAWSELLALLSIQSV
jgi:hypothetical protein